ncbi:MAG: hypothetical protein MRZ21_05910 [Coriobacteriaceae bacterium]|nr:hypothetical protein [Coriobacteriaceae bacterium]
MALTDAQRRAQEAYRKRSVKQVAVRFYPAEEDLWAWLSAQDNKAGYVKALIRADMVAHGGEGEGGPTSQLSS